MTTSPVSSILLLENVSNALFCMHANFIFWQSNEMAVFTAPERQYHKGMTLTMTSFNMINTVEPPIKLHIYQFKGLLLVGPNCTTVFIHLAAQTSQVVYRLPKVDHSSLSKSTDLPLF